MLHDINVILFLHMLLKTDRFYQVILLQTIGGQGRALMQHNSIQKCDNGLILRKLITHFRKSCIKY